MLIPIDQLVESERRFKDTPLGRESDPTGAEEILSEGMVQPSVKGNIIPSALNDQKRKEMLQTVSSEPLEFAYERAIGRNDAVYSNFCELIGITKQKVGRIVIKEGTKRLGYATGFMVSENLLLTNWHVFKTKESVKQSEVQFYYELDAAGNEKDPIIFALDAELFYHSSKPLDYCLVGVKPMDVENKTSISAIGYLYLDPTMGKLGDEGKESLNIIHHPEGDYKQLSIRQNLFTKITPLTIWYESDTAQGSSGSPVLNDQWQVVALHHMGIAKKNGAGEYLDKDNNIIPVIDDKIDTSRVHWIANEGIRISVILEDVFINFPSSEIVKSISKPPAGNKQQVIHTPVHNQNGQEGHNNNQPEHTNINRMEQNNSSNVHISFPASLVSQNGNIQININNNGPQQARPAGHSTDTASEEDFFEGKKLDRENEMDFSDCRGYLPKFLGVEIPMPTPSKNLKKFIAKLKGTDSITLKYYHYSVIFHSVRMMPVISAINVDGNIEKRKDETKRKDDWLRDNRLDYDVQLNDAYYKLSGFQKGHMARREDANWGNSPELAKLHADITCMYTNACPQVGELNQKSRKGLWGKLEEVVLEDGATREKGKEAKISVFNGPIFRDTDPVYKGIQVPLEFYKIILWFNDDKELQATGFKLTQEDLVGDIDFEAIDIDSNVEFLEFQCSIASLQKDTNLDFSAILPFDTFEKVNGEESFRISSEAELRQNIRKSKSKNKKR
jgi:endonuclease G